MTYRPKYETPDAFTAVYFMQFARVGARSCTGGFRGVIEQPGLNFSKLMERMFDCAPLPDQALFECAHVHLDMPAAINCAAKAMLIAALAHIDRGDVYAARRALAHEKAAIDDGVWRCADKVDGEEGCSHLSRACDGGRDDQCRGAAANGFGRCVCPCHRTAQTSAVGGHA